MRSESVPLIVLLAHPDDEFGVFPHLQVAVERGRTVHVVWLTDGGWGGQSIERRRNESTNVLERLGLDRRNLHFLGEEFGVGDGSLHLRIDEVTPHVVERLAPLAAQAEILIPAWEGGHHDHDATHLIGLELIRVVAGDARARQFSLYHGAGLKGPWFTVLSPLPENGVLAPLRTSLRSRLRYIGLCVAYPSQWKSFLGLLPFYTMRLLRADAFVTQPVRVERTAQRPHQGALLYERRGGPTWDVFAQATRNYRWSAPRSSGHAASDGSGDAGL